MREHKFLTFLILSLSLAAFFAGYVMIKRGDSSFGSKTGTILDKFTQQKQQAAQDTKNDNPEPYLLADQKVVSPINSLNKGGVMYFAKDTGKLLEIDTDNRIIQPISDQNLPNFISAIWSPNKKEVLNYFYSPTGNFYKYVNLDTSRTVELNRNIRAVTFSPDGGLITYYYLDEADGSNPLGKIVLSQPDGSTPKKILDTRLKDIKLFWPTIDGIVIKTASSGIFKLTEDGKLTQIIEPAFGLEEKWSPSGKKLLFSFLASDASNQGVILSFREMQSGKDTSLDIPGSAYQCIWSIDDINIFCSIPSSSSTDDIYKVNTTSGSYNLIAELDMLVNEFFLSPLEDRLFFTSTSDKKLYGLKISN